jgi:hypothetical protein
MSGITITIRVNGEDLTEYPTTNDVVKLKSKKMQSHFETVTRTDYVEVEAGHTFEIYLSVEPPYYMDCPYLGFRVFVDGDWIQEPICSREIYEKEGRWSETVVGPGIEVDGKIAYRSMMFKKVAVSKLSSLPLTF